MCEIVKLQKKREKSIAKQSELKEEILGFSKQIRQLELLHKTLHHEELQNTIMTRLKKDKMTDAQILKLLEVGSQIHEKSTF